MLLRNRQEVEDIVDKAVRNGDMKMMKKALELASKDGDKDIYYFISGRISLLKSDYQKAIGMYEKAVELNPLLVQAINAIGTSYFRLGQFEKAIEAYNEVLRIDGRNATAHTNKGDVMRRLHRNEEALYCYAKAIVSKKDYFRAYRRMVRLCSLHGLKEQLQSYGEMAFEVFKEKRHSRNALMQLLGSVASDFYRLGEYQICIGFSEKILTIDDKEYEAYVTIAICYSELKKYDDAIDIHKKVIALDANFALAHYNLACVYALTGETQYALSELRRAIILDPSLLGDARKDSDFDNIRKDEQFTSIRIPNVAAVVLAAGKGTRMRTTLSKLLHLHPISSQALVRFTVNACVESGIERIIVVVGHQAEKVKSALGEELEYVYQEKRLGTGDALKQAVSLLRDFDGELVVVPGDAPFITSSMLGELIRHHRETKPAATVLTALLSDPGHYGRIVRNGYIDGYRQIEKIVESRDASPAELEIKEVNSGIYCFDNQKLLAVLPFLDRSNKAGEYYLTDVVELFNKQKLRVQAMKVEDSQVVLGVNTPEELKRAWKILGKRKAIDT